MSPEFADCYSVSFEETHGSAAISLLQHLYTLMQTLCLPSKRAADVQALYELHQAEFHLRAPAQLGFLVASWHVLDHKMYFPDSEDNLRFVSFFFPPPCTIISSKSTFPSFPGTADSCPSWFRDTSSLLFLGTEDPGCRPEGLQLCLIFCGCSWLEAHFLLEKLLHVLVAPMSFVWS